VFNRNMAQYKSTRRQFLRAACASGFGLGLNRTLRAAARTEQRMQTLTLYVGTYTTGKSEGIYHCRLKLASGALERIGVTKGVVNPSYLTIAPNGHWLYAVNEVEEFKGQASGALSAFAIETKTGVLRLLNQQPSQGSAPCYVSVARTGKFVLVANYASGNVAVLPVNSDGSLGRATDVAQHQGASVNPERQTGPHAHCIVLDAANRYAFSADLGTDKLMSYRFDAQQGRLSPNDPPEVQTKAGAGPRHFTFHPNSRYAYLINALDSTLTAFTYQPADGRLLPVQTISALPKDFTGANTCADLHVAPRGRFLYGSNRGHDSIVVFRIEPHTGKLTYVEHVPTEGQTPRNFVIDPTGTYLLVANQQTDNIVSFRLDHETGRLQATGQKIEVASPVCLRFADNAS
jgi:6-phosphogluconolactonase